MRNVLVTKDNKGKIRVVEISYEWDDSKRGYVIKRKTYQYGGKITIQPDIWIFTGKAKRTVTEQVKLEYNSKLKGYTDKGYKIVPPTVKLEDKVAIEALIPEETTDSNGFKKHMNAKDFNKVATSIYDKIKYWLASRKIDGVRNSLYKGIEEILSASRGGGHYNYSTKHLREHPTLIQFFNNHPEVVLDGELYVHGRPLQWISGAARIEKDAVKCDALEFWIFDIMDGSLTAEQRIEKLEEYRIELGIPEGLDFDFAETNGLQIRFVPQEKVSGWEAINKLHDKYVAEGYEGVVIRDPSKPYNFGGRTNAMIKIKMYQDDEFEITGWEEGLRDEDMVFTLVTKDGKPFEAKPMGCRELKYEYIENMDSIIGKQATVKFFKYSEDGIPMQPSLKCIRDYE